MASAVSTARSFDPLVTPVRVPANDTWIAPATLDAEAARARARAAIAPHLTHRDDRDEILSALAPTLIYAPFWRVKLTVTGLRLVSTATIEIANIGFPMPIPSAFGRAGVMMIGARQALPYEPRLPIFFGGTDALEVHRNELTLLTNERAQNALAEGEIVDADVDRAEGNRVAVETLVDMLPKLRRQRPCVESTMFVRHPLWHTRFDDDHFILLSARDGKVVSARYPRPPTLSERVRRFFTAS